jgi:hypothetical protein
VPATTPWFVGGQVPLTWTNTDTAGNPQDAVSLGSVSVTVYQPDGTTATLAVTRTGTGEYAAVFTTAQAGHHAFTWVSTDATYPGAFGDSFEVSGLPDTTIVSLAEAKEILHQTSTTANDAKIQGYNAAVTNVIEYYCGPVIVQTVTETLPARGTETILAKPPVIQLLPWTEVPAELANLGITLPSPASPMIRTRVYGIEWPLTQLYVDPRRGIVTHTSGLPFFYCAYIWQYQAGRPVISGAIYEASKIILKHIYGVENAGTGTGTGSGDEETSPGPFGFAIPNRALELLAGAGELKGTRAVAA